MGAAGQPQWAVIVPLKALARSKTRLAQNEGLRSELAFSFVRDVVAAALASPAVVEVIVVTDDQRATAVLRQAGARVISDPPGQGDMNDAIEHGSLAARGRNADVGLAALMSDLPALTSEQLTEALTAAWDIRRSYVPDADGIGTTMLTSRPGVRLAASFGVASADEHFASGARPLELDSTPGLRRDVDTAADLADAVALGVGPATAATLAAEGPFG